ncbi:hypothetical protein Back2_17270 [Nocardioides baekrokdamisoli]|uniref:AB hydrolase-1 domain-containing protein n=1 Tax=Nocardioides baekrokdamisoli TaxID=1804624 RepID=A0A3G9IEM4_9ACTN|nr:alpha/beta hydrolase [Nocardioides baekrokdamisoli]BBH17440.1 hypothetical protein Back2_17270 [Nocardioides baekrokdamisoli]
MRFELLRSTAGQVVGVVGRAAATRLREYVESAADVESLPTIDSLPPAVLLEVPGYGPMHIVDIPGPTPEAPTILLFHAIGTTGYLTWFPVVHRLAESHRVVLLDHRWHGRGTASDAFSLEDCADDAAAVLRHLEIEQAIVAGYSMGGATAQMMWHRHPDLVGGLVLCSTSAQWSHNRLDHGFFTVLGVLNRTVLGGAAGHVQAYQERQAEADEAVTDIVGWCVRELRSTSLWAFSGALHALGVFDSTGWLPDVDTATAVVITTKDRVIRPQHQRELAAAVPDATVYEVASGHAALMFARDTWQAAFLAAVADITEVSALSGRTSTRYATSGSASQ